MRVLYRAVDGLARALFAMASVLLVFMMTVVVIDVGTRALFGLTEGTVDWTIRGGLELVRFSLLFTIVGALPAIVERGQVVVETFTGGWHPRAKTWLFSFYLLGFCGFGAILAYGWVASARAAMRHHEMTQDLSIPMAPIYLAAAFCAALLAARSLLCALRPGYRRGAV